MRFPEKVTKSPEFQDTFDRASTLALYDSLVYRHVGEAPLMSASRWAKFVPAITYIEKVEQKDGRSRESAWSYELAYYSEGLLTTYEENALAKDASLSPKEFAYVAAYIEAKNAAIREIRKQRIKVGKVMAGMTVAGAAIGACLFGFNGEPKHADDIHAELTANAIEKLSGMSPEEQVKVVFNHDSISVIVPSELPETGLGLFRELNWPILVPHERLYVGGQSCLENEQIYDPSDDKDALPPLLCLAMTMTEPTC